MLLTIEIFKTIKMKNIFAFVFSLLISFQLSAEPIMWTFNSGSDAATVVPTGVAASSAAFGSNLNDKGFYQDDDGNNTSAKAATKWGNTTLDTDAYIELCFTNNSGATFEVNNFKFTEKRSLAGPRKWDLKYKIGVGSMVDISTSNGIPDNANWRTNDLGFSVMLADGEEICFRIYGYERESAAGTWRFNDIIISGTGAIPITLLNFNATTNMSESLLSWSTLTETNNDFFLLEWSTDGIDFEKLSRIDGSGTSREKQEYIYNHTTPSHGVNYYRLTQFDFDGISKTFKATSVYFDKNKLEMLINSKIVNGILNVDFNQHLDSGIVQIFSINGQIIKTKKIQKNSEKLNINVSNIRPGHYFARYINKGKIITKKFIKL